MGTDGTWFFGDKRSFDMEAWQGVAEAMRINEFLQHGEIAAIGRHGCCRERRQKARNAFCQNLFNATKEGVFCDGGIGETRSKGTIDL